MPTYAGTRQIEKASKAEQSLLMEIAGGSLDRICTNDEVEYIKKVYTSKPHLLSNDPMAVVRTNPSNYD